MKRKMLAVLLLVAIFAAFAGQVYAMTSGTNGKIIVEEPNVPVPSQIYAEETEYYENYSDIPEYIWTQVNKGHGYVYSGYIPVIKKSPPDGIGGRWVTFGGMIPLSNDSY